jgi:two-component system nitrogen regulation sensor histidine kinase NtrY
MKTETEPKKSKHASLAPSERRRRKRELIIVAVLLLVVGLLTFAETKLIQFGPHVPVSNSVLMFILININLLLLILVLFLVFRNLVKLLYDRRRRVMGAKLRTKLVVAFITLSLLPTIILFYFSITFISTSIQFWFNVPVEQALQNSLLVGQRLYEYIEDNSRFYHERISFQITTRNLFSPDQRNALTRYVQIVQRAFNLDAVEIYAANAQRITFSIDTALEGPYFETISSDNLQKIPDFDGVRMITEKQSQGELIKTIATVPYGVSPLEAEGYVVLTLLIPSALSQQMASIAKGVEEYQQIQLLKEPIKATHYITLSIVALLIVFCAVWFGFYLARSISIPIMELAEGTRRVAEGDLQFSLEPVADDEVGSLVRAFNQMTHDLRIGREQLEFSAQILKEQNDEIEERRQYMEVVLENVSAGVISLDARGRVSTLNRSAERLLGLQSEDVLDDSYRPLFEGQALDEIEAAVDRLQHSRERAVVLTLRMTVEGNPKSFLIHINALRDDGGGYMGLVMVLDDLTELEKAERMAAWREVARRIAHEVKNPLTPITLSAQRLMRKFGTRLKDPVFAECTHMIVDHVEIIRNLVNEFSFFARFPSAKPQPCRLEPIIEETVALYREGHPLIRFHLDLNEALPRMNLDRQQIKQALINLIENAISAIREKGNIFIAATPDLILKRVRLEIADDGEGISDQDKTRLFEPNFSTKKTGMGLGLTIVNTIINGHNGRISVQDHRPRGAKFVIELPI